MSTTTALGTIKEQARERVERQLDQMEKVFGPLTDPELLGAVMDGAQEAVMGWVPESLYHPEVTGLGWQKTPRHVPGAYPTLSCCGGEIKVVPK